MTDFKIIKQIYNSFDHTKPLLPDDKFYVDCQEVRGNSNVIDGIGREILLSDKKTCQLYSGHRGVGKSTELLRLEKYLREEGYRVVYFDAAAGNAIDPEEARYTDVLLACTQQLLKEFEKDGEDHAITKWLRDRKEDLKGLASISVVASDSAIGFFTQIMANLRTSPAIRQKIRLLIDPHTPSLIEVLNKFIQDADKQKHGNNLVLIADGLDRIVPVRIKDNTTNHDEIFIERSEQLTGLECHVIYTVPISMVYSGNANDLLARYGMVETLPMIVVHILNN